MGVHLLEKSIDWKCKYSLSHYSTLKLNQILMSQLDRLALFLWKCWIECQIDGLNNGRSIHSRNVHWSIHNRITSIEDIRSNGSNESILISSLS